MATALAIGWWLTVHASAANAEPIAWWSFDGKDTQVANEQISGSRDTMVGFAQRIDGVRNAALKFDGFTTRVTHQTDSFTHLESGFTVEAWIAPQTYSWNWTGIVDQETNHGQGFSFGINHMGQVGLGLAVAGEWHVVISAQAIPLLE